MWITEIPLMGITTVFQDLNQAGKAKSLTHIINKECHKYHLELAEARLYINRTLKKRTLSKQDQSIKLREV
jgi:hypothetical protein